MEQGRGQKRAVLVGPQRSGWPDISSYILIVVQHLMHHFLPSPDDRYTPRSPIAITAVAWAPDGSMAVSGNQTGELTLWHRAKAVATAQVCLGHLSSLSM